MFEGFFLGTLSISLIKQPLVLTKYIGEHFCILLLNLCGVLRSMDSLTVVVVVAFDEPLDYNDCSLS